MAKSAVIALHEMQSSERQLATRSLSLRMRSRPGPPEPSLPSGFWTPEVGAQPALIGCSSVRKGPAFRCWASRDSRQRSDWNNNWNNGAKSKDGPRREKIRKSRLSRAFSNSGGGIDR